MRMLFSAANNGRSSVNYHQSLAFDCPYLSRRVTSRGKGGGLPCPFVKTEKCPDFAKIVP